MQSQSSWPKRTLAVLPYSRLELPGWGRVLRLTGVLGGNDGWEHGPTRTMRCKTHGHLVPLDLSNWSERLSYFLGRHHEIATALFLQAAVHQGDTFIDIGTNVGFITLHASALVGATGRVHCFEPNPKLVERLQKLLTINKLDQVTLHPVGLSDSAGELALNIVEDHHEQGTFSAVDLSNKSAVQHRVPICVADQELPADLPGPATVKIDVEGFEVRVLRGMRQTIERLKPIIFTEVSDDYLRRAGNSVAELFDLMKSMGYAGYHLIAMRRIFGRALQLLPIGDSETVVDENVVWINRDSVGFQRLAAIIA